MLQRSLRCWGAMLVSARTKSRVVYTLQDGELARRNWSGMLPRHDPHTRRNRSAVKATAVTTLAHTRNPGKHFFPLNACWMYPGGR